MLNIFLIQEDMKIGRQISALIQEAGYSFAVYVWEERLKLLSKIEQKRPDILLFCSRMTDTQEYGILEFFREARATNEFLQILMVTDIHSTVACKIALEAEADWLLCLDEAQELLGMLLYRMEDRKTQILKTRAEMVRYQFAAYIKDKDRLSHKERGELFRDYQKDPYFQVAVVHVLPPYRKRKLLDENNVATLKGHHVLDTRLEKIGKRLLTKDGVDVILCLAGSVEDLKYARLQLDEYLKDMREVNITITRTAAWVSMGKLVKQFEDIPASYHSARTLLNARFFCSSIGMLEFKEQRGNEEGHKEPFWIYDVRKALTNALETLDEAVVHKSLMQLKSNIMSALNFNENDVFVIYRTLVSVFFKELESREIGLDKYSISYDSVLKEYEFFWNLEDLFSNLEGLYLEGISILREWEEQSEPAVIIQAKSYIRAYFNMPLTLKELSDYVGMNENYFSDYFSKYVKMTFKQYLTELRIRYSKQLLLDRQYSMEDIAEAVGYNDVKYFLRVFKRVTGITPGEYRTKYYVSVEQ